MGGVRGFNAQREHLFVLLLLRMGALQLVFAPVQRLYQPGDAGGNQCSGKGEGKPHAADVDAEQPVRLLAGHRKRQMKLKQQKISGHTHKSHAPSKMHRAHQGRQQQRRQIQRGHGVGDTAGEVEQFAQGKNVGNQPQLHQMLGAVAAMPYAE